MGLWQTGRQGIRSLAEMVGILVEEFGEVRMDPGLENDKWLRVRIQYNTGYNCECCVLDYLSSHKSVYRFGA